MDTLLPPEILDYIYTFTDLDTILKQQPNNKYLINYFKDIYKEKHKEIHEEYSEDTYTRTKSKFICNKKGKYQKLQTEIKADVRYKYETNFIRETINVSELKINEHYVYYNLLELHVENPDKKSFNELFNNIVFEVGGQRIFKLSNEEQINIYAELFKINKIKEQNGVLIIPLPFFVKNQYFINARYHETKIILDYKENNLIYSLYGYTYDNIKIIKENLGIIQQPYNPLPFNENENGNSNDLNFRENILQCNYNDLTLPTYLLSCIVNLSNIEYIVINLDDKHKIKYNLNKMNIINKGYGYTFNYPTIIFDENFFDKRESTLNFSRIHNLSILFFDNQDNELIREYNLISINYNILINQQGMYTLIYTP